MNYEVLLGFIMATGALAISPGPDNIFVLTLSMANGRKYGLATVAGLMTGCLVHTTLLAFGVSEVIKHSPSLFFVIKIFGAAYLVYLAYQVYNSDSNINLKPGDGSGNDLWSLYKKGFWMNVLNPKVTIFFLAFFPAFLFHQNLDPVVQFYVLGFVFILVSSLIFGAIAVMAGTISAYLKSTKPIGPFFKWLQIIVFLAIAVYLLISD